MHHLYPLAKGDQLCPLGFHPQVRWPTRCKRCFRDYKEHGGRRGIEEIASSSPNLSDSTGSRALEKSSGRTWTSTQNLSTVNSDNNDNSGNNIELRKRPSSWTSTPDLDDSMKVTNNQNATVSLSVQLPRRRHTTTFDEQDFKFEDSSKAKKPPIPPSSSPSPNLQSLPSSSGSSSNTSTSNAPKEVTQNLTILKTDSLAERFRKMNLLKKQNSTERESSRERSVPRKLERDKSLESVTERDQKKNTSDNESKKVEENVAKKTVVTKPTTSVPPPIPPKKPAEIEPKKTLTFESKKKEISPVKKTAEQRRLEDTAKATQDVQFMLQIKQNTAARRKDDEMSTTTETTDTTLVDPNDHDHDLQEEMKSLKHELQIMKTRAEKAEREKSDILLRRIASMDTGPNRTAASEALKLQQKVNELKTQLEELKDDKRCLTIKVKELEQDLDSRPAKTIEDELRRKLQAAEQLCEELMDENEDIKKELHGMEQEIDEMHDNFREDQVEEFTTLRKDLEQTTKNCRILSFKLKKSERKIEQLENEKQALGLQNNVDLNAKVKKLEEDLRVATENARKLQVEADLAKNPNKKRPPSLGVIGKSSSADGKFSRESLTRGGSQEDPAQLLRDLQDSMEREADLKEQLKFAEEEAESLRKKASRVEDENESLMMQLKKMATKARSRKLSPTPSRLTPEPPVEHDEGISDEDDPAELRVLLELNEQEASVLRQKVEHLEAENIESLKQVRELQEKLKTKNDSSSKKLPSLLSKTSNTQNDKKIKALEDELSELQKLIIDKDRNIERLQAEITASKNKSTKTLTRSDSLENTEKVDLRRQLEMVEQEASVLRGKTQTLEQENEQLSLEIKKMQLQSLRKNSLTNSEKNGPIVSSSELNKLKENLSKIQTERDELSTKLKIIIQEANDKLPPRTPKKISDLTPKANLKKMVEELEDEIKEMRAIVVRAGGDKVQALEKEKAVIETELKLTKEQLNTVNVEMKKLSTSRDTVTSQAIKIADFEQKLKKTESDNAKLTTKIKETEDKVKKLDMQIKQLETVKGSLENQLKQDKGKMSTLDSNLEKAKAESKKWESKVSDLDNELNLLRKTAEKTKSSLEKEIQELKSKSGAKTNSNSNPELQEMKKKNEELTGNLSKEAKKYSELNGKFENLHEEHVLIKAQLAAEKQNLQTELSSLKLKLSESDSLKSEKSELTKRLKDAQKKISDLEAKSSKMNSLEHEKSMLKRALEEKEHAFEKVRKENEMNTDFAGQLKKDNEELRRKMDDFDKVNKVHRTMNEHNSNLENEIKKLRIKLENTELAAKSDVASTRLRFEQQVKNVQAELTSMQRQCERFKKDRDTFKQLLEAAQKTISELKQNSGRQSRTSVHSGDEDDRSKILFLEQQVGCLEDQLCESRLEVSKVKTELISQRSAAEIKISEMTSKINEIEEDRLIGSGRTKIPGMKTKLELSWQKEREDQQRLLQEMSTLARDLRQTLFEVERERDKERLESKRKLDQLKRANEEEQEEGRKKISELQYDLLELRDAHARLRTSNEKLRRDRERYERELLKRRLEQDGERKVGALLQTVDELVKIAPELKLATQSAVVNSNASDSSKLKAEHGRQRRSPSPGPNNIQLTSVLARLTEASEELRRYQRLCEDERERDKSRRSGLRRASSTEKDNLGGVHRVPSTGKLNRSSAQNGSLYRKSLSLDQSIHTDQSIWRQDEDSFSSMQSIDSEIGGTMRESSMDSRLSGGSTQSDIPRGPRKKKRSLMGKLRSLTKSGKSAESEGSVQGSDSDLSISSDIRSSKKDLKGRLSGMFKRSSSQSRSASTEQGLDVTRPVAVTVVGTDEPIKSATLPAVSTTPRPLRTAVKPPTPNTPSRQRKAK